MQDGAAVMTEPKKIGVTAKTPRSFLGIDYLWPDAGGEEVKSTPKPVTEVDPVAQAKAAARQAAVRKALEAEVKARKFKTNDEVLNRAVELFSTARRQSASHHATGHNRRFLLLPPPPSSADLEKGDADSGTSSLPVNALLETDALTIRSTFDSLPDEAAACV